MPLKVDEEKNKMRHGINSNLTLPLLKSIGINSTTELQSTRFDKNKVTAQIRFGRRHPVIGGEELSIKTHMPAKSGLCFKYHAPSRSDKDAKVEFSLRSGIDNKADYLFTTPCFHKAIDAIFGTRKHSFLHKLGETLESRGLPAPEHLDVSLQYKLPTAVWRALPPEFIEKISGFRFQGPFFRVSWPRRNSSGHPSRSDKEQLEVDIENAPYERNQELLEAFRDQLLSTGFVEYSTNQGPRGRSESKFVVDPNCFTYPRLQLLEELTRQRVQGVDKIRNVDDRNAEIEVTGKLGRDAFYHVPAFFDISETGSFIGKVKAGQIEVASNYGHGMNTTPQIAYNDATLEDVERFMGLPLSFSEVYIRPKKDKRPLEKFPLIKKN